MSRRHASFQSAELRRTAIASVVGLLASIVAVFVLVTPSALSLSSAGPNLANYPACAAGEDPTQANPCKIGRAHV